MSMLQKCYCNYMPLKLYLPSTEILERASCDNGSSQHLCGMSRIEEDHRKSCQYSFTILLVPLSYRNLQHMVLTLAAITESVNILVPSLTFKLLY